jgi:hypothetical protein
MSGLIVMHLHARNVSVIGALLCTRGPSQLDIPLTMNPRASTGVDSGCGTRLAFPFVQLENTRC